MLCKKINISPVRKSKCMQPKNEPKLKADFYIKCAETLVPAQRSRLNDWQLVAKMQAGKKILLVDKKLDVKIVQTLVAYSYGNQIQIETMSDLEKILQSITVLQIGQLAKTIQDIIITNIKCYDVFEMLQFAYEHRLEALANTCLAYLYVEQFEQAKYHQYSLYECDFTLFQIVIRRHHMLKLKKKINGLPVDIIQSLIDNYCRRNYYQDNIKLRLHQKYVNIWKNIKKDQSNKSSGKLQKISCKGVGQSTTIYGNDSQKRFKQQQFSVNQSPTKLIPVRARKFSVQIQKQLQLIGFNLNHNNHNRPSSNLNIMSSTETVIPPIIEEEQQDQGYFRELQPRSARAKTYHHLYLNKKPKNEEQDFLDQIEVIKTTSNIEHKSNQLWLQEARAPNAKSMIFQQVIEQEIQQSTQFKNKKYNKKSSRFSQEPQILFNFPNQ